MDGVSLGTITQLRVSLAASDDTALAEARALFRYSSHRGVKDRTLVALFRYSCHRGVEDMTVVVHLSCMLKNRE